MVQYPMQRIGVTASFDMYNPFSATPSMHYAIDISRTQPKTFDVYAAHDGKVILSLFDSGGGNMIGLQGAYNDQLDIITRYAHLSVRSVAKGESVVRGVKIGVQGATGSQITAQHLHFETWLVPKGYSYNFNDRPKYAVDPLGICKLLEGQQFVQDADTFNYAAFKSPDPAISTVSLTNGKVTVIGSVPMYIFPDDTCSPIVSGYNRSKKYILDFFSQNSYTATKSYTTSAGAQWANISTAYGPLWLPIIKDKSILTSDNPTPPNPECEKALSDCNSKVRTLEQQILHYQETIDALKKIVCNP